MFMKLKNEMNIENRCEIKNHINHYGWKSKLRHQMSSVERQRYDFEMDKWAREHQEKTEKVLQEKFGIDTEKYGLSYMVAFGYRKNEPREKSRRTLENIVTWK